MKLLLISVILALALSKEAFPLRFKNGIMKVNDKRIITTGTVVLIGDESNFDIQYMSNYILIG